MRKSQHQYRSSTEGAWLVLSISVTPSCTYNRIATIFTEGRGDLHTTTASCKICVGSEQVAMYKFVIRTKLSYRSQHGQHCVSGDHCHETLRWPCERHQWINLSHGCWREAWLKSSPIPFWNDYKVPNSILEWHLGSFQCWSVICGNRHAVKLNFSLLSSYVVPPYRTNCWWR